MQLLIIFILFALAAFYLGRMVYRSFKTDSSCTTGCGKCGVDFKKVEAQIRQKQ